MVPWLMTALIHGGLALKRVIEGGRPPAPRPMFEFKWHALAPCELEAFLVEHPLALRPPEMADVFRGRGQYAVADSIEQHFVAFAREHRGYAIAVELLD